MTELAEAPCPLPSADDALRQIFLDVEGSLSDSPVAGMPFHLDHDALTCGAKTRAETEHELRSIWWMPEDQTSRQMVLGATWACRWHYNLKQGQSEKIIWSRLVDSPLPVQVQVARNLGDFLTVLLAEAASYDLATSAVIEQASITAQRMRGTP